MSRSITAGAMEIPVNEAHGYYWLYRVLLMMWLDFGAVLPRAFYERATEQVARDLLGRVIRHGECAGKIVETEAYLGSDDLAAHSAQ